MRKLSLHTLFIFILFLAISCASKHKASPETPSPGPQTTPTVTPSGTPSPTQAQEEVQPFYEGGGESEAAASDDAAEEPAKEEVIGSEVEEEIAKSVKKEVPQFDIPIVVNAQVEKWMNYFQGRGRKYYATWLARSERYIPMMKKILRENGLPEDLVYLAMIESGFKSYAYSRAKASGQWQFIRGTGRLYGLRVNFWMDERRDPVKSTVAAAQHLKDLYDQFNSWYLAAASYNAGAGKITRAIKKYSTEDFWEMSRSRNRYLKPETKNYVPKLIAAALMAKTPERYGFTDIQYDPPLEYDKVAVPEPVELSKIASICGIPEEQLLDLNPELLRGVTPPDIPNYEVKIPRGMQEKFNREYETIRRSSATVVTRHVVRRGESLAAVAHKYHVDPEALRTFNRLSKKKVKTGQQLAIPFYVKTSRVALKEELPEKGTKKATYQVKSGDTLWAISRRFNVSVAEIRKWNTIPEDEDIRKGQKLRLYARADPAYIGPATTDSPPLTAKKEVPKNVAQTYQVKDGDTLWDISKKFGVKTSDLIQWNGLEGENIRAGQILKVR